VEAEKLNPPSIFVAARSRGDDAPIWATVGKLTKQNSYYEFRYTMGARKLPDVAPFPGLPDLEKVYQMEDIFPIFKNRLLSERRPEYKKWLSWGGFDPDVKPDAISVLSTLGSRRAADSLELFTGPLRLQDGSCYSQFFLHGVRHHATREILERLHEGAKLILRREDSNPHDQLAVAVDNNQNQCLGYVPRFLAKEARFLSEQCPDELEVKIKRSNVDAPSHYQVLCELTSCWPDDFSPCTDDDFKPISGVDAESRGNLSKIARG